LDLSRMTRSEMRHERVDLSALARNLAKELQRSDPERAVEFVLKDGIVAEGDQRLLRVVLENLLRNAWKFTGSQPQARVEFGLTELDGTSTYSCETTEWVSIWRTPTSSSVPSNACTRRPSSRVQV
jgi:signal transduction histidine kinase